MGTRNLITKAFAYKLLTVGDHPDFGPEFPYLPRQYTGAAIRKWIRDYAKEFGVLTLRIEGTGTSLGDLQCRHDRFYGDGFFSFSTVKCEDGFYVSKRFGDKFLPYDAIAENNLTWVLEALPPRCERCSRVLDWTQKRIVRRATFLACADCVSMMHRLASFKVSKADADTALLKEFQSAIAEGQEHEASSKRNNLNCDNSPDVAGRPPRAARGGIAKFRCTGAGIRHQANNRHNETGGSRHADAR